MLEGIASGDFKKVSSKTLAVGALLSSSAVPSGGVAQTQLKAGAGSVARGQVVTTLACASTGSQMVNNSVTQNSPQDAKPANSNNSTATIEDTSNQCSNNSTNHDSDQSQGNVV